MVFVVRTLPAADYVYVASWLSWALMAAATSEVGHHNGACHRGRQSREAEFGLSCMAPLTPAACVPCCCLPCRAGAGGAGSERAAAAAGATGRIPGAAAAAAHAGGLLSLASIVWGNQSCQKGSDVLLLAHVLFMTCRLLIKCNHSVTS